MLKEIVSTTANYTKEHGKAARKKKGQFFTPLSIVDFMVKKGAAAAEHLSILEPGAGNGLLTAALIKQWETYQFYWQLNKLITTQFI